MGYEDSKTTMDIYMIFDEDDLEEFHQKDIHFENRKNIMYRLDLLRIREKTRFKPVKR